MLRLAEGILDPDATLRDYFVTDQLAKSFNQALGVIRDSLQKRSSHGSYLHGSFGAGKSHFMAVLHLILIGNQQARAIPELAEIIQEHNAWMAGKKFLLVPYHMIGATSPLSACFRLRLSKRTGAIPWQGYPSDRNWFHQWGQVISCLQSPWPPKRPPTRSARRKAAEMPALEGKRTVARPPEPGYATLPVPADGARSHQTRGPL